VTSRIWFVVETVENRGKTVWLAGVNREGTVHGSFTGRSNSMAAPFGVDVGPSGLSLGIRVAMPSATEHLWPARKFQGFLGEATATSRLPFGKNPKSRQLSRGEVEPY